MTAKFGWCIDGHHAPPSDDPGAAGCPGQIGGVYGLTCSCSCHTPNIVKSED
jgi:hypothetical protein